MNLELAVPVPARVAPTSASVWSADMNKPLDAATLEALLAGSGRQGTVWKGGGASLAADSWSGDGERRGSADSTGSGAGSCTTEIYLHFLCAHY